MNPIYLGKIKYDKWRMFETERRVESSKNFIDGDLIESYLELSPSEAANLVKDFKVKKLVFRCKKSQQVVLILLNLD